MACKPFLYYMLALCFALLCCVAQSTTPIITGATTLKISLESLSPSGFPGTTTIELTETISGVIQTTEIPLGLVNGIRAADVTVQPGYVINNFDVSQYAICWFPVSGNWQLIPRVIFYVTILFALVARAHQWLIAGALAASLSFSGVAAIQIILQVWAKQMIADLDLIAIFAILSVSCIVALPLLTWDESIRNLGREKIEKDDGHSERPKDAPTLSIIIVWALLVVVGFFSAFTALEELSDFNDSITLYTYAGVKSLHCVPDGGVLDLTAGQKSGVPILIVDNDFISTNNCDNPCASLPIGQKNLFRSASDLRILTLPQIDNWFRQRGGSLSVKETDFIQFCLTTMIIILPLLFIQGIMHVFIFRRQSPAQARHKIHQWVLGAPAEKVIANKPSSFRKYLAFVLAFGFYIWTALILCLTPFLLALDLTATELALSKLPQSESNIHVGQWGPLAGTALVLVAALISRFEYATKKYLSLAGRKTKMAMNYHTKYSKRQDDENHSSTSDEPFFNIIWNSFKDLLQKSSKDFWHWFLSPWRMVKNEWKSLREFCHDALK